MTQPPRKDKKRTEETHVYLTKEHKRRLRAAAETNERSMASQILVYLTKCLDEEGVK